MEVNLGSNFILFIDSGMGGLTILENYLSMNDSHNVIYYADTEHFPYGGKTEDTIGSYLLDIYSELKKLYNISLIVIACNTASVSALSYLRERIEIPIVGTVPAVKLAASVSLNKVIGVIATETTVNNGYISGLISEFAKDCKVYVKSAPELVEAVESDYTDHKRINDVLLSELSFFTDKNIDCIVLGCTHYSFVYEEIRLFFKGKVNIIDSREGVSKRIIYLMRDFEGSGNDRKLFLSSSDSLENYLNINRKNKIFNEIFVKGKEWKRV